MQLSIVVLVLRYSDRFRYMDHAGPEISVNLCIASLFSRQIAIGNAGPTSALESVGAKPTFCCHILNIGAIYQQ